MKNKSFLFLLAPLCATLFSCSFDFFNSGSKEPKEETKVPEEDKPFEKMVSTNLAEGTDYVRHDVDSNNKWNVDETMWYINNLDKVPLPDPQVFEEDGTYYIVGTDDSSSCRYIPCYRRYPAI